MPCSTCRHSSPVPNDRVAEQLVRGSIGGRALSVLDMLPDKAEHPWVLCRAHESLVPADDSCEHFGKRSVLASLFRGGGDRALYEALAVERKDRRARDLADAAARTAVAEEKVKAARVGECLDCGLVHVRCPCGERIEHCGTCSVTRGCRSVIVCVGVRWICLMCERTNPAPKEPVQWAGGLCDWCRSASAAPKAPVPAPGVQP